MTLSPQPHPESSRVRAGSLAPAALQLQSVCWAVKSLRVTNRHGRSILFSLPFLGCCVPPALLGSKHIPSSARHKRETPGMGRVAEAGAALCTPAGRLAGLVWGAAPRCGVEPCRELRLLVACSCLLEVYRANNVVTLGLSMKSGQGSELWLREHSWERRSRSILFLE